MSDRGPGWQPAGGQPAAHPDVVGARPPRASFQTATKPASFGAGLMLARFGLVLSSDRSRCPGRPTAGACRRMRGWQPTQLSMPSPSPESRNLDALLREPPCSGWPWPGQARRQQVVDVLLALLHPAHVAARRDIRARQRADGGGEAQQTGDLVPVPKSSGQASLRTGELLPEAAYFSGSLSAVSERSRSTILGRVGPDVVHHAGCPEHASAKLAAGRPSRSRATTQVSGIRWAGVLQHETA